MANHGTDGSVETGTLKTGALPGLTDAARADAPAENPLIWKTRVFAAIVIASNAFGNFFLARGMRTLPVLTGSPVQMIEAIFTPLVALGVSLLIIWLLTRMMLLSWSDLSYMLPVTSLGYVANALLGRFFLHEHISMQRWAGTLLIVAGTVLVGLGTPRTEAKVGAGAKP